jgi:hypothetical protein
MTAPLQTFRVNFSVTCAELPAVSGLGVTCDTKLVLVSPRTEVNRADVVPTSVRL